MWLSKQLVIKLLEMLHVHVYMQTQANIYQRLKTINSAIHS